MKSYSFEMNRKLDRKRKELTRKHGVTDAELMRRALTLYALAKEKEAEGYELVLTDGESRRQIIL